MPYNPAFTGLRAFAAFLIFYHHYYRHWSHGPVGWAAALDSASVSLTMFFTLSGFLITRTYWGRFSKGEVTFREYWFRRIARILPVYWVLLSLTMVVTKTTVPWKQFFANFTLTQAWFSSTLWTGLWPAWSLTVEESFYLLAPLAFVLLARKARPLVWGTTLMTLAATSLWSAGKILSLRNAGSDYLGSEYLVFHHNIFGRFIEFIPGVLLALWVQDHRAPLKRRWIAEMGFAGFFALTALGMSLQWTHDHSPPATWEAMAQLPIYWMVSLGTVLYLYSAQNGSRLAHWILGNRVAEYLGRLSYCFYLLQGDYYQVRSVFNRIGLSLDNPLLLYLVLNLIAAVFYECIEKPVHRYLCSRIRETSPDARHRRAKSSELDPVGIRI